MITPLLKESIEILQCDRAVVAKLHSNSSNDLNYTSFSIMFEELSEGTLSIYNHVKNIPSSVLSKEFGKNNDIIVIGNKKDITQIKCLAHLDKLNVEVIINQLLYNNIDIWGVLSFQYKECPSYLLNQQLEDYYLNLIKSYKFKLMAGLNEFM